MTMAILEEDILFFCNAILTEWFVLWLQHSKNTREGEIRFETNWQCCAGLSFIFSLCFYLHCFCINHLYCNSFSEESVANTTQCLGKIPNTIFTVALKTLKKQTVCLSARYFLIGSFNIFFRNIFRYFFSFVFWMF